MEGPNEQVCQPRPAEYGTSVAALPAGISYGET